MSSRQPCIIIESSSSDVPRVVLSKITEEELATLWPVDPETVANMTPQDRHALSCPPAMLFDELSQPDQTYFWGIRVGQDEELAGIATLRPVEAKWQDFGIAILRRNRQDRGVGKRVVLALADCAFSQTEGELLYADPLAVNIPMRRVLESAGFICLDKEGKTYGAKPGEEQSLWVLPKSVEAGNQIRQTLPHAEAAKEARATHAAAMANVQISYR